MAHFLPVAHFLLDLAPSRNKLSLRGAFSRPTPLSASQDSLMLLVEATGTTAAIRPFFATTADIPVREKFAYWHDVVCRNLVDLEYRLVGDRFDAAFHAMPVAGLHLCRIQASPHRVERSNTRISRSTNATFVFNFVLSGSLLAEQDGRVAQLHAGDGALCDADRPYKLHSNEAFDLACIRVPRQVIASRIGHPQRLSAFNFSERSELAPMVFAYLSRLVERAPELGDNAGLKVAQNFMELLISMVAEFVESNQPSLTEYRGLALMRVKATIERALANASATPATIAAELNLSQRYINQLLEEEGTSLSRYLWSRRLERCAEQLRSSALRGRSVSQIAMENGFNDLSHFSKAFRNRFGASPRDFRSMASAGTLA
jgi:AraC family transcriptional activator of tynA and feaB